MAYRTLIQTTLAAGALFLLAACATRHPVAQADWDQGAREGKITRDYALPGNGALPACLAQLPPEERAARHFVQVRYNQMRHVHFDVAELPAGVVARLGDRVEIWPADCAAGQVGRIAQVFAPAP